MSKRLIWVPLIYLCSTATAAHAASDKIEWTGDIGFAARLFPESPQFTGQDSTEFQASISGTAEFRWQINDKQRVKLVPRARLDQVDNQRNLIDLSEAFWSYTGNAFEVLVGFNTVFWGVTESVHLVDIVNQTDFVADLDGESKLGQPMISVSIQRNWGELTAFVLPFFRERTFAGNDGRLRFSLPIDDDDGIFESSAEQNNVDFALRYSHFIGNFDVGLSLFTGTNREARFEVNDSSSALQPIYEQITQLGADIQYTSGAWLWKLETFFRNGATDDFFAAVGGFEYTQYQLFKTNIDLGYLVELQYDGRAESEPFTIAENDVFFGARLTWNDTQDTALLAGAVIDVDTREQFFNIEAERRLGSSISLNLRARGFGNTSDGDILSAFSNDNYLEFSLKKFF